MSSEPTTCPVASVTRLPAARAGKIAWATPVTTSGYTSPVRTSVTTVMRSAMRISRIEPSFLGQTDEAEDHVDRLDADEGNDHATHAIDEERPAQEGGGAQRPVLHAAQGQRDEHHDDERVEDDG